MKIIAINGSPRKTWNTASLLQAALDGCAEYNAETKMYHLYDYTYSGCVSCFACRRINSAIYGQCSIKDSLTPILEEIHAADGLIMGAPIYLGASSGMFRCFFERLIFPTNMYDADEPSLWGKHTVTGLIYTMGAETPEYFMDEFNWTRKVITRQFFEQPEVFYYTDAYQFDDYSKYHCPIMDVEAKLKRKANFEEDKLTAYNLGRKIAERINNLA